MPARGPAFRSMNTLERDHLVEESLFLLLAGRLVFILCARVVFLLFLVCSRSLSLVARGILRRIRSSIVHLRRRGHGRLRFRSRSCVALRFGTRSCFILVRRCGATRGNAHIIVVAAGG